ncbi:hypothetical protein ACX3YG_23760 [Pseudomonas wadenswilerensis]
MNTPEQIVAPGDLDPNFGTGGVLTLPPGFSAAVTQLSTGKLLVAGRVDGDVALLRLHSDGTTDTSFGEQGINRIYTLQEGEDGVGRIAVFPDDSVVMQGSVNEERSNYLLRTTPSGDLDTTFGNAGHVSLVLPGVFNPMWALHAQADGKVLLAVGASQHITVTYSWIIRLDKGAFDPTFGPSGEGMVRIEDDPHITDLVSLPDGRLSMLGSQDTTLMLFQRNEDGSPDLQFGENGVVSHPFENMSRLLTAAMLRQPDGKIAVAGDTNVPSGLSETLTARFLPDGSFDPAFNGGKPFIKGVDGVSAQNTRLALQRDGKLITGGLTAGTAETSSFLVRRFKATDGLDPVFGDDGEVLTDLGGFEWILQMLVQQDGKILATGRSLQSTYSAVIVRYLP